LAVFWGSEAKHPDIATSSIYGVRVTALADDGKQQHYYFMLIPGLVNDRPYPGVIKVETLSFPAAWVAREEPSGS
jgi:hypothetical protein